MTNSSAFVQSALEKLQPHLFSDPDGKDAIYWCPLPGCNDAGGLGDGSHGHLYINKDSGYWNCFRCGRGGKDIRTILTAYGIEISYIERLQSALYTAPKNVQLFSDYDPKKDHRARTMLEDFGVAAYPVPTDSPAYAYLKNRGMSDEDISDFWKMWARYPDYVFWQLKDDEGKTFFYSGRLWKTTGIKGYMKYMHSSTSIPLFVVKALERKPCPSYSGRDMLFLVEGIFDALGAPSTSIPMLGKRLAGPLLSELVSIINRGNFAPICALDSDAQEENIKLARTLYDAGISEVYLFNLSPSKDFGERRFTKATVDVLEKRMFQYAGHNEPMLRLQLQ